MSERRPSVFIGSSAKGLPVAKKLQQNLDWACEVVIWYQGVFGLSGGTLETLVNKAPEFDFAILVVTPDDMLVTAAAGQSKRVAQTQSCARDNVLIEIGLFIGVLGRERTFIVYDRTAKIKIPSDLAGVTFADFEAHSSVNLESALGAASTKIENSIAKMGIRPTPKASVDIQAETQFQVIADLLETPALQFLILMQEQNLKVPREHKYALGISYEYGHTSTGPAVGGTGSLSVRTLCDKLPDAGLVQHDLREMVSLTDHGRKFARWLVEHGRKTDYWRTSLGGWGEPPEMPLWRPNMFEQVMAKYEETLAPKEREFFRQLPDAEKARRVHAWQMGAANRANLTIGKPDKKHRARKKPG